MSDPFIPLGIANAARVSTVMGWSVLPGRTDFDGNQHERRMIVRLVSSATVLLYGADMDRAIEALIAVGVAPKELRAEMCEPPTVDIAAPGRA